MQLCVCLFVQDKFPMWDSEMYSYLIIFPSEHIVGSWSYKGILREPRVTRVTDAVKC